MKCRESLTFNGVPGKFHFGTPKLTLNYGLRYTYQSPWVMWDNRASYLDLRTGKLALPEDSNTITVPPLAIPALISAYPFETTQQAPRRKRFPDAVLALKAAGASDKIFAAVVNKSNPAVGVAPARGSLTAPLGARPDTGRVHRITILRWQIRQWPAC